MKEFVVNHHRVDSVEPVVGAGPKSAVIRTKAGGPVVILEPVLGMWVVKTWTRARDYQQWRMPSVEQVSTEERAWQLAAARLNLEKDDNNDTVDP